MKEIKYILVRFSSEMGEFEREFSYSPPFLLNNFLIFCFLYPLDSFFIFFSYMKFIYQTLFLLWNKILQCVIICCCASYYSILSGLVEINIEPNHNKELLMKWCDEKIKFRKSTPWTSILFFQWKIKISNNKKKKKTFTYNYLLYTLWFFITFNTSCLCYF